MAFVAIIAAQLPVASANDPIDPAEALARSVHLLTVGHSSRANPYRIGRGLPERGWELVLRDTQGPLLVASGSDTLWLHNPFGAIEGERMQWSAREWLRAHAHSGDAGAQRLIGSFLPAMRSLLNGEYTGGRRINLVAYLGDARTDLLLSPYAKRGEWEAWEALWRSSVEPIRLLATEFPGQVTLGADATFNLPEDHPHHRLLSELHDGGLPVLIESRCLAETTHLHRFGLVQRWRQEGTGFDRSNPELFPQRFKLAPNSVIQGPRFGLYQRSGEAEIAAGKMSIDHLRRVLEAGARPVLHLQALTELTQAQASPSAR